MKSAHEISIEMAADVVRLTQDMQRAQSIVDRGMQGMAKSADVATKALGALGVTLSLGAVVGMVRDLGRVSNEITNMSRAAGLGVEQFQVLAFGAERFGVSQEKLADIVKDTQDKIGDFVQTGGGAMADFFENIAPRVGVTVEQFRALNGADALQLYVSSLEKANLSQADMVFYMEAIASDSTLLLPLLQDGGKALATYGDSARRMGKILDEEAVQAARSFDNAMKDVADSVDGAKTQMVVGLAPAMVEVAASISSLVQNLPTLTEKFGPYLAGGAVTLGLMALPGLVVALSTAVMTSLLPALVATGPYIAGFAAVAGTIGFVIDRIQDANSRLATVEKAQAQVEILQKQIAAAEGLMESGQGSAVTQKRLEAMRKELSLATKAVEDFKSANEKIPPVANNVGVSLSGVKKTSAELAAENKRNAEIAKAVTNQLNLLARAQDEANDARAATLKIEIESTAKIQQQVEELRGQTDAYGQNEKGLRRLELAKIDDQIATIQMRISMAEYGAANRDLIPVYQAQVQALRDLKVAKEGYFDKKAVVDQASVVQDSFSKIFADISSGLTDALIQGFDNGKGIVESFFDYLKNYAKSLLVKIPVQYITAGVGGLFGVAGAANANASQFGGFGDIGGSVGSFLSDPVAAIKSAYSAFTGGASFLTANSAAEFSSLISDFGFDLAAQGGVLKDFGTSVFNNAEALGQLGQAAGVAFTALSAFDALKDGRYATAIGTGIGYAFGGTLGATLGNFAGSLVDKVLGFGGGGGRNAFGTFDTRTGANVGTEARFRHEADLDGSVATFGQAFEAQYRQIVETLGGLPGDIASYIRVKTDVGGDSPSDAYFSTYIDGQLVSALGRGGIGRSSEELQAALEDYAKRNLVAALAKSDIDVQFRSLFASVDVAAASIKDLESVLEMAQTMMQAQARFTSMFGTDTEKLSLAQKNLNIQFLRLGQQMPVSVDQFKELILAQDRTTESGRSTYLSLLDLAEQFAQVKNSQLQLQAAFDNTKAKAEQYLAVLGGQTQSTLEQVASQMAALNNKLASTTDPSQRIALEGQLSDLIFQRYQVEVEMLGTLLAKTQELFASIQAEKVLTVNARSAIAGAGLGVMSVEQIRTEIAQASALGSMSPGSGLDAANRLVADLQSQTLQQQSLIESLIGQRSALASGVAGGQQTLTAQLDLARAAVSAFNLNRQSGSAFAANTSGGLALARFDEQAMRAAVDYAFITYSVGREADVVALRSAINTQLRTELGGRTIADALFGANNRISQAQRGLTEITDQLAAKTIELAQAQARATELQAALQQAEVERVKAQEVFADSISQYVIDASKAVGRLSKLREETVKYYEAQERLAQLMGSSADGLRGTVRAVRFGDMNAVSQLQGMQIEFAKTFASAQAASGENLASYGTSLNGLIDPLLQKAAEVYASGPQFQAIKEAILSQALAVADRLESLQPKDYQTESLGLLDTIDTTLELIEANTKSAEAMIVSAINESKLATNARLEAVLAAIQGNPIPGFANGGVFGGGVRLVGERGPEIELTGASRIIPNNRLGEMLRPFDTRGIESRLDMIARDTAAQVRVLTAGMTQQSKQIDMLIDENRALRKKMATMEPAR